MSRRREANRSEAIVRGIGAIIMVILLWGMVNGTPGMLKNPADAIGIVLSALMLLVILGGATTVLGLIVWVIVLKRPRNQTTRISSSQSYSRPSARLSAAPSVLTCADCGAPITSGIADYCYKRSRTFGGKSLCMSCQTRYRP
jgi:hypothetical protein